MKDASPWAKAVILEHFQQAQVFLLLQNGLRLVGEFRRNDNLAKNLGNRLGARSRLQRLFDARDLAPTDEEKESEAAEAQDRSVGI